MKNYAFKILFSIATLCGFINSANGFEGELHYRSLSNADETAIELSRGKVFNGVRDFTVIVKGDRVLLCDNSTSLYQLFDRERGYVIFYSKLTKQGVKIEYPLYVNAFSALSSQKRILTYQKGYTQVIAPTLYKKEKIENSNLKWKNMNIEYWKGTIEHPTNNCNWELLCIDKAMPTSYFDAMVYGLETDKNSLISKFVMHTTMKLQVSGLAKAIVKKKAKVKTLENMPKAYYCIYLDNIQERTVGDSELDIPSDITVSYISEMMKIGMLDSFNFQHYKAMKAGGIKLEQENLEYDIKDEWDF